MTVAPASTSSLETPKKSKKQKKGEKGELATQVNPEQGEKKRKEKHRGEDAAGQEVATPTQSDVAERPKKKRKSEPAASNTNEHTPAGNNETVSAEVSPSVKPKKEKRPKDKLTKSAVSSNLSWCSTLSDLASHFSAQRRDSGVHQIQDRHCGDPSTLHQSISRRVSP